MGMWNSIMSTRVHRAPTTVFDLERTGDTIRLIYDGLTLDTVTWTSATWDVTQQYSHQVNANAFDNEWANDLPQNWCQAPSETLQDEGWYGTPGGVNSLCNDSGDDADGDGFTEATGDCNDEDPEEVNPSAIDSTEDPMACPMTMPIVMAFGTMARLMMMATDIRKSMAIVTMTTHPSIPWPLKSMMSATMIAMDALMMSMMI